MDWRNGVQQSEGGVLVPSTLWLHGDPGAGKTIQTWAFFPSTFGHTKKIFRSYVIDHLRTLFNREIQDVAIAYVYCEHKNRLGQTTLNLMSMLVKQVVLQFRCMPKALVTSYRKHADGANMLSLNGSCELLSELLRSFRRSFLIVDALDEYVDEEDEEFSTSPRLLETLKRILVNCQPKCRLFLMSRPDRLAMSQAMKATLIEIRADENDISLGSTISLRKLKEQLSVLPARLNEKYGTDLARILEQPLNKREFATRIIGWVLHVAEPLSVQGLQHALAVEQDDEYFNADGKFRLELLLETTAGLLTTKETDGRQEVQFFHHSVADFFRNIDEKTSPKVEQDLAETCVLYLSLKDFTEPCKAEDLDKRCQDFPFLRYASKHWGRHVTRCSRLGIATSKKAQEFIQPGSMPLGSLQLIATKVLHLLHPERIRIWKNPPLHLAIVCGLDRIVEELINDERVDLEARGHKDETALHLAARSASQKSVELLIRHKANINATNCTGRTALDVIMELPWPGYLGKVSFQEYLELWVLNKCLILENDLDDITVEFHLAANAKNRVEKAFARSLNFTDMEQIRDRLELTRNYLEANLQMDISDEQESIVNMLIEAGVDINSQSCPEVTSLQLAAIYGRVNIVRSLLDHGANPFLKREMGCTALALAEKRGHADIAHLLSKWMETLALTEKYIAEEAEILLHPGPRQAKYLEERAMDPKPACRSASRQCSLSRLVVLV
ncbi:MAG: hypothetical protein Q9167_002459 [Letrouitia subvulpina]